MNEPADDLGMTRRAMYRLARRTFRYKVYVVLEALWLCCAVYVLAVELFMEHSVGWLILSALAFLSLIHSVQMTLTKPWQLLKAGLLGAVVFVIAFAIERFVAMSGVDAAAIAVIVGSGYYFWLGELWTKRLAIEALGLEA